MDIDELAPHVGHAGNLIDLAGPVQFLEAGITIGVHPAFVLRQVPTGVCAFAVRREPVPGRRRRLTGPRAFVAAIDPQARGLGLAGTGNGSEQLHRGVVGEDRLAGENMTCPMASASGAKRAVDLPTQSVSVERSRSTASRAKDLGLSIKRQVIRILRDQTHGPEDPARPSAFNRARRQRGLGYRLTAAACHARTDDPVHHEATGNIFQLFRDVFAELPEFAAAVAADLANRQMLLMAW